MAFVRPDSFLGLAKGAQVRRKSIDSCLRGKVIPVVWDPAADRDLLARASAVSLQGGALGDLSRILDAFGHPHLEHLPLFVHVDLVAGLENNEAGIEYLADFNSISGVVTVHHHLCAAARRLGMLSIVRLFLSDSRAVDRGLSVVRKSQPDAIEILPAVVAAKVASDFADCHIPRIAGGLLRTESDVADVLASGCRSVTSTSRELWKLNPA